MLNRITLMGRLVRDPLMREAKTGQAAFFTVACERDCNPDPATGRRPVDFIDCAAWGGTAGFVGRNFARGDMIIVDGRLRLNDYTDENGARRRAAQVTAERVCFGSRRVAAPAKLWEEPSFDADYDFDERDDDEDDGEIPF